MDNTQPTSVASVMSSEETNDEIALFLFPLTTSASVGM